MWVNACFVGIIMAEVGIILMPMGTVIMFSTKVVIVTQTESMRLRCAHKLDIVDGLSTVIQCLVEPWGQIPACPEQ